MIATHFILKKVFELSALVNMSARQTFSALIYIMHRPMTFIIIINHVMSCDESFSTSFI